jgi:hypothetical protein
MQTLVVAQATLDTATRNRDAASQAVGADKSLDFFVRSGGVRDGLRAAGLEKVPVPGTMVTRLGLA